MKLQLFGRTRRPEQSEQATDHDLSFDEPMFFDLGESLDPNDIVGASMDNLEFQVRSQADAFESGDDVDIFVKKIADSVANHWRTYSDQAAAVLNRIARGIDAQLDQFEQTKRAINDRRHVLLGQLNALVREKLSQKADRIVEISERMTDVRKQLRAVSIQIFGDPEANVAHKDPVIEAVVLVGAIIAALGLEFSLNFKTMELASSYEVSAIFSVALSFISTFCVLYAARGVRAFNTRKSALEALNRTPSNRGKRVDQVTGQVMFVPPVPGGTMLTTWIAHILWIGLCASVFGFRLYYSLTHPQLGYGGVLGTFAFVAVVGAFYLFEVHPERGPVHPRLKEYFGLREEFTELSEEAEVLNRTDGENEYDQAIESARAQFEGQVKREDEQLAADADRIASQQRTFAQMREQFQSAAPWFRDRFLELVGHGLRGVVLRHDRFLDDPKFDLAALGRREEIEQQLELPPPVLGDFAKTTAAPNPATEHRVFDLAKVREELWPQLFAKAEQTVAKRRRLDDYIARNTAAVTTARRM